MAVRDDRSDVKQTTAGFRGPLMVQSLTSAKSKFLSLHRLFSSSETMTRLHQFDYQRRNHFGDRLFCLTSNWRASLMRKNRLATLNSPRSVRTRWTLAFVSLPLLVLTFVPLVEAEEQQKAPATVTEKVEHSAKDDTSVKTETDPGNSEALSPSPSNAGFLVAIISLAVIAVFSLSMTFWLYRWRRRFTDKYEIIVPEDWRAISDRHEKRLQFQDKRILELTKAIGGLAEQGVALQKMIESMTSTYMGLQGSLDEKDEELGRFKKGYDSTIYRNFLKRFIRVDLVLQSHIEDGEINVSGLEQIRQLLEDALDECGLEVFQPELNEDYAKAEGVEDYPKTVPTQDPNLIGKIIEVRQPGYRLQETGEVIQKAKVTAYSEPTQEKEGD